MRKLNRADVLLLVLVICGIAAAVIRFPAAHTPMPWSPGDRYELEVHVEEARVEAAALLKKDQPVLNLKTGMPFGTIESWTQGPSELFMADEDGTLRPQPTDEYCALTLKITGTGLYDPDNGLYVSHLAYSGGQSIEFTAGTTRLKGRIMNIRTLKQEVK